MECEQFKSKYDNDVRLLATLALKKVLKIRTLPSIIYDIDTN